MLPTSLALIDNDAKYTEFLSQHLRGNGVLVDVFADSNDLLAHADAFGYDFYLTELALPGVDGINLIKVLRRRTNAGLLVVSGVVTPEVFQDVINAGADMILAKPVPLEQVRLAVMAVRRRVGNPGPANVPWRLDRRARQLIAPDGIKVDLSDADQTVMESFIEAAGDPVTRESLRSRLGRAPDGDEADGLNATIYRLRRRIERATPATVPLQSKSRVGYLFRAPLVAV